MKEKPCIFKVLLSHIPLFLGIFNKLPLFALCDVLKDLGSPSVGISFAQCLLTHVGLLISLASLDVVVVT